MLCPLHQAGLEASSLPYTSAYRPHQNKPEQNRPGQARPDQTILSSYNTMGFLCFLCDCFKRRSVAKPHSKPSYARLVEAKEPPAYCSLPIDVATMAFRRSTWRTDGVDEDARLLPSHLTLIDEKEPLEPIDDSAASSPRSSTVSLPSTRVTALTVTTDNTGGSRVSRMSRESGITFEAPPSYSSRRSVTYQRSNRSSWDRQHPVHAEDWFDQFQDP